MTRKWTPGVIVAHVLFYGVFLAACAYVYYLGAIGVEESDLPDHFMRAADMSMANYSLNRFLIYPGYAIGDMLGASILLAAYTALTAGIVEYLIFKMVPRCTLGAALVLAFMANFAIAIFIPMVHPNIYSGVVTGNSWHNSTYLTMRLFALLAILFYLRITGRIETPSGIAIKVLNYLLFAVCVFVATGVKPSFYVVFAPAILVMCIIDLKREGKSSVKRSILLGICLVIPLIIVATQYDVLFNKSENAGGIGFGIAVVWQDSNDNIPVAILQSFAFPFAVLIGSYRQIAEDRNFLFAWLMALFGFLEYFFIYETGPRMYHANFAWSLQLGAFYLMASCSIALLNAHPKPLEKLKIVLPEHEAVQQRYSYTASASGKERAYVYLCLVLYALHALSGLLLFGLMFTGHSFLWKARL